MRSADADLSGRTVIEVRTKSRCDKLTNRALQDWATLAAGMPNAKHLELAAVHPVVHEVLGSIEKEPAHLKHATRLNFGADVRLLDQDLEPVLDIFTYCTWGGKAICRPPSSRPLDFTPRARLDPKGERHCQP